MDKETLRKRLKARRQELSPADVDKLSHQIINNVWPAIDWTNIQSVHVYLPIQNQKEIDTAPLIRAARQLKPSLKFASTDPTTLQTEWFSSDLQPLRQVPENFQYGLVIVPLLAFDGMGHRLGYGGGFYDRFLENQEHALTIGLCYESGHLKELPKEAHDVPLKLVVTEKTVYKF